MEKCRELVLRSLNEGEKSFWELLNENEYDIKTVILTLNELLGKEVGFSQSRRKFYILREFPYSYLDHRCKHCKGRGYIERHFSNLIEKFRAIVRDRPLPKAEYDQGFIEPKDLALKAAFMYQRGDIFKKEMLILGDDDLFSIFVALTKLPKRIVVVDIDERVLNFIEQSNLNIETVKQDLSRGIPDIGKFDCFVTEPPESLLGLKTFVEHGMKSLSGEGCAGYIGLTRLESSWSKWHWVEKFILDFNFAITDIIRDFSIYPEIENQWSELYSSYPMMKKIKVNIGLPNINWFKSALIRIEKVKKLKEDFRDLYIDEETLATAKAFGVRQ